MGYPKRAFRVDYLAADFAEIAVETYLDAKVLFDKIKKQGFSWFGLEMKELDKKSSIVITFCSMAIESFLNDYAAACFHDDKYYGSYDSLSIQNKFQLIVQFILQKEFKKDVEPYGLLGKLTKNRNKLVHNKSYDGNVFFANRQDKPSHDISYYIQRDFNNVIDSIRAVVQLVNYFEQNDLDTSACERMFAKFTLCLVENEKINPELKVLLDLGLNVSRIKK